MRALKAGSTLRVLEFKRSIIKIFKTTTALAKH